MRPLVVFVIVASLAGGCAPYSADTGTGPADATSVPLTTARPASPFSPDTIRTAERNERNTQTQVRTETHAARANIDQLLAAARKDTDAYRLGRRDVIDVSVFKVPELSSSLEVNEVGAVNIPLIGEFDVSGKTAREVEHALIAELGRRYLQNPQVSVRITQMNSRRVTLEGAVKRPGLYPLNGGLTLLQAIATAEGLTDTASTTVVVFRKHGPKQSAARFDLDAIRSGTAPDPRLQAGDVVIARDAAGRLFLEGLLKLVPLTRVFTVI